MTMADLDWNDLHALLAVVDAGSLTGAARVLGCSQPTVGRRLDALEARLGLLVERTAQGCRLTPRGHAIHERALQMRRAVDDIEQVAQQASRELEGTVTVACGDMVARLIVHRASRLREVAPGIGLEVVSGLQMVNLERGDADLALRNQPPTSPHLTSRRLGPSPFAVFCHRDRQGEVEALPWIGYPTATTATARWLDQRIGLPPDLRVSSMILMLEACRAGVGRAVLPAYCATTDPELVRVEGPLSDLVFETFLVSHVRTRRLPRVRLVARELVGWLREAREGA
ncbi:MAG: LysR family transcriptional regulator [Myxococcota bacterium]